MSDSVVGKRWRVMIMAGEALFGFMRGMDGRAAYRLYGMPTDTKMLGIALSPKSPGAVAFLLESKQWDPILEDGGEIPEIKFEILTALMPARLEKPKSMLKKLPATGAMP